MNDEHHDHGHDEGDDQRDTGRITQRRLEAVADDERGPLFDSLAHRAAAGDAEAAATLAWAVRRFRLARPALRRYLINDADIDGGEQRTMIAVAYRIGTFRSESKFTTWLHQVATNEAKQMIRRESRHSDRANPLDEEGQEDVGDGFVQRVSSMLVNQAVVREAIARLGDDHRRALMLREDDGLTYEEIADRLDVPIGTAKTWVRRGRADLALRLAEALSEER